MELEKILEEFVSIIKDIQHTNVIRLYYKYIISFKFELT